MHSSSPGFEPLIVDLRFRGLHRLRVAWRSAENAYFGYSEWHSEVTVNSWVRTICVHYFPGKRA